MACAAGAFPKLLRGSFSRMIEIGIGFFFAILFVSAYLLVKKLMGTGEHGQARWRELSSHPIGGSKRVAAKPPTQRFLTTGEMREHHSKKQ
jgi:hypothetical protein